MSAAEAAEALRKREVVEDDKVREELALARSDVP